MISKPFGFDQKKRLRSSGDFRRVFKHANRLNGPIIRVLYCQQDNIQNARLGVIIRKKDIAHAVDRNRIRRIARNVFRQQALSGLDIVIFAKPSAKLANNKELAICIEQQLEKCKVSC